jgi:hypothetical protein
MLLLPVGLRDDDGKRVVGESNAAAWYLDGRTA